jgi:hypothetical protein
VQRRFGVDALWLHGRVPRRKRDDMVERFQEASGPPVLVVSLKAGGTGLNLTAASHVVHFDRWWNPAVEDQATDRAYRIGQRSTVLVHKLVTVGTIEEHIDEMITSKRALAEQVVGSGEQWITELSTEELRAVVALLSEAFEESHMARSFDDRWRRYPPSVPLPAENGLVRSKARGAMANTWWSYRFVDVLESYGLGARMQRGRRYARTGQVLTLDVRSRLIVSQVQGSRRTPYVVTIGAPQLSARQWKKIDAALRARIGFVARLLAGKYRPISKKHSRRLRSRCFTLVVQSREPLQLPGLGEPVQAHCRRAVPVRRPAR